MLHELNKEQNRHLMAKIDGQHWIWKFKVARMKLLNPSKETLEYYI